MVEEVAALSVRLEATAARFEREVQRATRTLDRQAGRMERRVGRLDQRLENFGARFGKQLIAGLGAFAGVQGIRRLAGSFQETLDRLDAIAKQADKLGVTTEALQELRFAAEQSGVAVKTFDTAFQRFTRRAAEAANGTGTARDALRELNVQLRDSNGEVRAVEDLFMDAASALAQVENQAERVRLAFKLFDSEGAAIVNMVDNLERLRQKARDLGIVMREDVVRDAVVMKDELSNVFQVIGRQWDRLMLRMARNFVQIFDLMPKSVDRQLIETMTELADVNERLRNPGVMRGPTDRTSGDELRQRQRELQERADVLRGLQRIEEEARRRSNEPLGSPGGAVGGGGGAGGGGAAERKADFVELLELMEREASALERRIAVVGMSTAEEAAFLAETEALNRAREMGIELTDSQRETIRIFASDVGNLAEMEERLREETEARALSQEDAARSAEEASRAVQQMGNRFLSAIQHADSFADALKNVALQLANIAVQSLSQPGGGFFGSLIPGLAGLLGGGVAPSTSPIPVPRPSAKGNVFQQGSITPFARGGIVRSPTLFPMAQGAGLMGEAGPEAIMPLKRGAGGKLGVEASGGGGNVFYIDNSNSTAESYRELQRVLEDTVGPGRFERRAVAAVADAKQRGHPVLRGRS